MNKVTYIMRRIKQLDYKRFFQMINQIKKKTKKNRLFILLDIINCAFRYQSGYMDYDLFEMYRLNKEQRKTILTRGINNTLIKYFNNPTYYHYFLQKNKFNETFSDYLNRDWILLDPNKFIPFEKFIEGKTNIIAKPVDGTCGKNIEKIYLTDKDNKQLFSYLLQNQLLLIEDVINQDEEMNTLHPHSVNTVRVITMHKDNKTAILGCYLRIGNGKVVDNFNSGGMVVPVNWKTGSVKYPALDKSGNLYEKHPITNYSIIGFEIPYWDEVKELVTKTSKKIPQIGLVGWDVAISKTGPCLVEGNEYPGHDIYQLPPHRTDDIGMVPELERALTELNINKKDIGL